MGEPSFKSGKRGISNTGQGRTISRPQAELPLKLVYIASGVVGRVITKNMFDCIVLHLFRRQVLFVKS